MATVKVTYKEHKQWACVESVELRLNAEEARFIKRLVGMVNTGVTAEEYTMAGKIYKDLCGLPTVYE